jgi:putative heme transporter
VVLNLLLWTGLVVSIPLRGVNALYGAAALVGILLMVIAGTLVLGIMDGQGRSERVVRRVARAFRLNEDRSARVLRHLAVRLSELTADRQMLRRLVMWASLYWLLDAAALWVFLRAFGGNLSVDGLIVAFGLANVMAAIPITPGGLGVVEWVYIPTLVGFGLTRSEATLGVVSYRIAQFWLPIMLGTLSYLSLRLGPFSIDRRGRLEPLQEVVERQTGRHESLLDFSERFSAKDRTGGQSRPADPDQDRTADPQ